MQSPQTPIIDFQRLVETFECIKLEIQTFSVDLDDRVNGKVASDVIRVCRLALEGGPFHMVGRDNYTASEAGWDGHYPLLTEALKTFKAHICLVAKRILMNAAAGKSGTMSPCENNSLMRAVQNVHEALVTVDDGIPVPPQDLFQGLAILVPLGITDLAAEPLRKTMREGTIGGPFGEFLRNQTRNCKSQKEAGAFQFWTEEWIRYATGSVGT
jgi:hypothetical protein